MKNTYTISKQQITYLSEINETNKQFFKENYPEAFEPELKTGIWYKSTNDDNFFFFLESIDYTQKIKNYCRSYGFNMNGMYEESDYRSFELFSERMTPATEEEVLQRLEEEAIKRGFKKGVTVDRRKIPQEELLSLDIIKISDENEEFEIMDNILHLNKYIIMANGIWADICITKADAEKELGKKIIE